MRQIDIKQFDENFDMEVKDLPFEITENGEVIAFMLNSTNNEEKPKKITASNNNTKTFVPTGGSLRIIY